MYWITAHSIHSCVMVFVLGLNKVKFPSQLKVQIMNMHICDISSFGQTENHKSQAFVSLKFQVSKIWQKYTVTAEHRYI